MSGDSPTIILLGPPGSGKGTQASKLCEELNLKKISTGDIIRDHIARETDLGKKVKALVSAGELVPDNLIISLFEAELDNCKSGFVADGFPRTLNQAEEFDRILSEKHCGDPVIFFLKVDSDILVKRIIGRRTCSACKRVYNVYFAPPLQEGVCDADGNALLSRDDDTEDVIKNRFKVYDNETAPVLRFYGERVITLDASQPLDDVFKKMTSSIGQKWLS
jgi:adenylate kinase